MAENIKREPFRYLSDIIQEAVDNGVIITDIILPSPPDSEICAGYVIGRKPSGEQYGPSDILKEKRGVVNVDIVGSTKYSNLVQFVKVAFLHKLINNTLTKISNFPPDVGIERLIPVGDGVFLIFGNATDSLGGIKALAFSIHFLCDIEKHNKETASNNTSLVIKISATWGDVIPFADIEGRKNFLGDSINECARINLCASSGDILICERLLKVLEKYNFIQNGNLNDDAKEIMGLDLSKNIKVVDLGIKEINEKGWKGSVYKIVME